MVGSRVLVTGADGFIGSHLVERLVKGGDEVRALCLYNSNGSYGWLDEVDPEIKAATDLRLGDVRDGEAVAAMVAGVDVVLHLAALIAIPYSYEAPASYVDTNVSGTLNVLQAARRHGARMIHTSTSEVYGTPDSVPIRETHPLKGQSPYSATKIAADKLCESFACSFGTPVAVLRPFNTFGPRQSFRAVIPTVLGQLLSGAESIRLGSLHPRRDFTFVSDTVEGLVAAASADLAPGEVIQLGTGTAVSIGELVDLAVAVVGRPCRVEADADRLRPEGSEVEHLQSDPARARDRLGWSASVSLEEGLRQTAAWLAVRVDAGVAGRYHR